MLEDSQKKVRFFEPIFFVIETGMKIVLGILFLFFSNLDKKLGANRLIWKSYIVVEALHIAKRVKLINKREFVKAIPDKNANIFVL